MRGVVIDRETLAEPSHITAGSTTTTNDLTSTKQGRMTSKNRFHSHHHHHKRNMNDVIADNGTPDNGTTGQISSDPGSLNAINDILLSRIIDLERKYEEERASNEQLRQRVTEMEKAQDQYVVKYNSKIEELMEMIDQIYDEIYKLVVLFNLNEMVEENMPFHEIYQNRTYKVI